MTSAPADAYEQLAPLLAHDPDNIALIADVASAAYDARRLDEAEQLLARHRALAPLGAVSLHLAGLIAMARQDWEAAVTNLRLVDMDGPQGAPVRYNLAWSLAMLKRKAEALDLLDPTATDTIPQAAQLRIGLLHDAGVFEEAEGLARSSLQRFPDHRGVAAAVSTLAIDIEDRDLALAAASRAPDHPEAMVTLATLALGDDQTVQARRLFDQALERRPDLARAWVGRGLSRLGGGDAREAAGDIDRGADLFASHLGSWIAAGWAYALAGDTPSARARFERALAIDDNFAEAHGSLAVADLAAGDVESAKRRTEVAMRLDRRCFSGALASAMLAASAGDSARAEHIVRLALDTPVDAEGRTVAQALARLGLTR